MDNEVLINKWLNTPIDQDTVRKIVNRIPDDISKEGIITGSCRFNIIDKGDYLEGIFLNNQIMNNEWQ